ncbi:DUF4294 domain-containing protein [Mesonia sp. HuA40]|uniref:DUF4294 domain-containing protein n=1 Tax=Mesonia sp. HuA40 TaxID=2602761 RepID=UPI002102F9EC|nr:DUF4294 domain-containing protein [Mesonia sp. HuA40]
MHKFLIFTFSFIIPVLGFSQKVNTQPSNENNGVKLKYLVENDSTIVDPVELDEVVLLSPMKFKSRLERREYLILKRKTRKVWPYATLAAERLQTLNKRLENLERKADKRRYTKIIQRYIEEEFTQELKNLTKTEGQILVKLMYRQTGKTTFDIVKNLKSGWRAFWYNTTASMFNISLKEEYDPSKVKEDYYIEHILQRSFQRGILKKQPAALEINVLNIKKNF